MGCSVRQRTRFVFVRSQRTPSATDKSPIRMPAPRLMIVRTTVRSSPRLTSGISSRRGATSSAGVTFTFDGNLSRNVCSAASASGSAGGTRRDEVGPIVLFEERARSRGEPARCAPRSIRSGNPGRTHPPYGRFARMETATRAASSPRAAGAPCRAACRRCGRTPLRAGWHAGSAGNVARRHSSTARPFSGMAIFNVHNTPCPTRRRYSARFQFS